MNKKARKGILEIEEKTVEEEKEEVKEPQLNLYQKLAKIREMANVVKKDKKGFNYRYADLTSILASVQAGMKKYGVSLIPNIQDGSFHTEMVEFRKTKFSKSGEPYEDVTTEIMIRAEMDFTWLNDEDPSQTIKVHWHIVGSQQDPSQAFGSALTYCTRYFMTEYFQIAQTEDDPDNYRSRQKEAEEAESREVAAKIVEKIDLIANRVISKGGDKIKPELKEFIGKYVKGGDYFKIKEPKIASKLLNDLRAKYFPEEIEEKETNEPTTDGKDKK